MKKFFAFILLVVLAVCMAGLYGVIHNQVSYTVSPEYFTKFKFLQFGLSDTALPERLRASVVGFLASWWMGIPIGILVGAAGLIHRGHRRMLRMTLWSFGVMVAVTLLVGLAGLAYGYARTTSIDLADYRGWFVPSSVVNLRRFLCAGYMHNASYLGGLVGVVAAWIFHVAAKVRDSRHLEDPVQPLEVEREPRLLDKQAAIEALEALAGTKVAAGEVAVYRVEAWGPVETEQIWIASRLPGETASDFAARSRRGATESILKHEGDDKTLYSLSLDDQDEAA